MPLSSVLGAQSITKPGVCTSTTRPSSPFDGQVIYETDTDRTLVWNNSAWVAVSYAVYTSSTRPSSPYEGQIIYETDTTRVLVWSNSAWVGIAKANNVTVNSSGIISGTQQPRFLATRSGDTSYAGGSVIVFNTAVYNIGSHYSTTTGLLTAPVSGTYIFDVGVYQSAAIQQIWFIINGSRERSFQLDHTGNSTNMAGQGIVFLNAGDTCGVASWSGGATVTMYSNFHHNYLRGCLIS